LIYWLIDRQLYYASEQKCNYCHNVLHANFGRNKTSKDNMDMSSAKMAPAKLEY